MIDDVKDFIITHFLTSARTDTPYWLANRHELHVPDSLRQLLELQKAGVPIKKSYRGMEMTYTVFEADYDRFWTNSNFQMVLSGVGYLPEHATPLLTYRPDIMENGEKMLRDIKTQTDKLLSSLPSHYEYLKAQKEKLSARKANEDSKISELA